MSNRSEKEQRRQERLAAEQAAKQSADRRRRFGLVGGVLLLVAVIAIVGVAALGGGDDDGGGDNAGGGSASAASVPPVKITNLSEAARAAGCKVTLEDLPDEGAGHTTKSMEGKYKTNPPTSGAHDPTWSEDGIYEETPDLEKTVHTLEHGRIDFQYKPGAPAERIAQLEAMVNEEVKGTSAYHTLMFPNGTGMEAAVAATAWRRSLTCPEWNDQVFDAMRAFRKDRIDKGPEFIP